jgi:hypothetical protein
VAIAVLRPVLWVLGRAGDSRRRRHMALIALGVALCGLGLVAYGLVAPEIPFERAPVTFVGEVRADQVVKVFGRVDCDCTKAIDREERPVAASGRTWNATFEPFHVSDPSGRLHIDTTAVTRLTPGPTGGDWMRADNITVYGSVYDQGGGNLALRAEMIAKAPDDTPAKYAFWALVSGALGALSLAFVLTDRLVFGGAAD